MIAATKLFGSLLAIAYPPLYLVGTALSLFGSPLVSAGFLSWLKKSRSNPSELSLVGFYMSGRKYYPVLLLSSIGIFTLVFGGILFFALLLAPFGIEFFSQFTTYNIGEPIPSGFLAGLTYVGFLVLIITLTPIFIFQFVSPSIVVSDNPLFRSYADSARVVYENLLSVFKYNLSQLGLSLIIGFPASIVRLIATAGILSRGLPPQLQLEYFLLIPTWANLLLLFFSFTLSTLNETIKGSFLVEYYLSASNK